MLFDNVPDIDVKKDPIITMIDINRFIESLPAEHQVTFYKMVMAAQEDTIRELTEKLDGLEAHHTQEVYRLKTQHQNEVNRLEQKIKHEVELRNMQAEQAKNQAEWDGRSNEAVVKMLLKHPSVACWLLDEDAHECYSTHALKGSKIEAIKLLRAQLGLGLKDAKDVVEAYIEYHKI